jgi:peptidoglycan hydrolase CwlO-like protein
MFRKVLAASTAAILVSLTLSVPASTAATKVSNGVPCTKAGTTTKVSGFTYRCAKNTLVKNSKLTWLSVECLDSIKSFQGAVKAQSTLNNSTEQIKLLTTQYESISAILAATTTALDNAKAAITKTQATMNATTDPTLKGKLAVEVRELADAIIKLTNSRLKLNNQVRDLDKERKLLTTAPQQLKNAASDARSNANLLCTKGL